MTTISKIDALLGVVRVIKGAPGAQVGKPPRSLDYQSGDL
jgi:hypothetical protein